MQWSDVGSAITKYAPLAGAALSSPVGAVVGLGAIVANLFGVKSTPEDVMDFINKDPSKAAERLQYEMANNLELQKLALKIDRENNRSKENLLEIENEKLKAINDDTKSARENSVNIAKNPVYNIIAIILVAGSFVGAGYCIHVIGSKEISATESPLISMALGMFLSFIAAAVGFIFGSSIGSQIKDSVMRISGK